MKKKKSEMSGLVLLLFSTLTLNSYQFDGLI